MNLSKKSLKLLFLLMCVLIMGGTAGAAWPPLGVRTQAGEPTPTSTGPARPSLTVPQGSPAITPRLPGVPSFTTDDVLAYFQLHPFLPGATSANGRFTITQVSFLTNRQVSALLNGATTGYTDDALLCSVLLSGDFLFPHPPETKLEYDQGVVIFDARSGNFVISGGMAHLPSRTQIRPKMSTTIASQPVPFTNAPPAFAPLSARPARFAAPQPFVPARPAYTCLGNGSHCYGVMDWRWDPLKASIGGGEVNISFVPLQGGNGFLDNEMWVVQRNNPNCADSAQNIGPTCWAEAGMIAGSAVGLLSPHYFWADNRPTTNGGIFLFHDMGPIPVADQNPASPPLFAINEDFANELSIGIVGFSTVIFADSTNTTMVPGDLEMGQELEGSGGATSGGWATYSTISYTFRYEINIGGLPFQVMPTKSLADSPPFTGWVTLPQPTQPPTVYPSFQTSCC